MKPLGILLISGGHERAHYAFVLAAGAAALGRKVVLFATNEGTRALLREPELLPVPSREPAGGSGPSPPLAGLAELRSAALEIDVRLIACELGLLNAGVAAATLLPEVEIAGVVTFLNAVGDGQMITL